MRQAHRLLAALLIIACAATMTASQAQTAKKAAPRPVTELVPPAPPAPDTSVFVPAAARLVSLPKLTETQIKEFINDLLVELELANGYHRAGADSIKLPPLSDRVNAGATTVRKTAEKTDVLRFGYVLHQRRLPQLWIYGITVTREGLEPNADAEPDELNPTMQTLLTERSKIRSRLALSDLQSRIINLSYIDADGALFALRAMGFSAVTDDDPLPQDDSYKGEDTPLMASGTTADDAGKAPSPAEQQGMAGGLGGPGGGLGGGFGGGLGGGAGLAGQGMAQEGGGGPGGQGMAGAAGMAGGDPSRPRRFPVIRNMPFSINFDRLPLIVKMPTPEAQNIGLVGASTDPAVNQVQRDQSLGLTVIPSSATQLASTISAGTSQLLVLFHPENIEQFVKIRKAIEEVIDKPARQVFVEGLVLEISKQGIDELGVQWTTRSGANTLQLGTVVQLAPNAGNAALNITKDSTTAFDPRQFIARINALVDKNKAEILSRPSVLTLDNRQATIRVGTDIPIATSKDTGTGAAGGRVAFSFQYLPTGILLNVRPRINEEGREISMLIDATVSATVPGQDLRVTDPTGALLASAPTISTRRVQTYARIINNTPLIIGGLVSRDQTKQEDKVPGLGDIPIIGRLFGYESNKDARREVIIVLTPSVLTEEFRATKPQLPKDDDRFDLSGTTLFREAYRIRAEDLIDSQYIRFNRRFLNYRSIANQAISRNPDLANVQPYAQFRGTRVPGEFIFVSGMMSRMLARLKAGDPVNIDKLTFFEGVKGADFKTESVGGMLKRLGDGKTHKSFFEKNKGKALTLRFRYARASKEPGEWATEPLAEVNLVDCPDREAWKKLVWDMNQPVNGVQQYYTLVINDESDLERIKLAIALKNTILANGNESGIIFDNFLPGRMLAMQEIAPEWERTLEATIGRYFYFGEFFYPAFSDELERSIQALDSALRRPEMARLLDGIALP